MQRIHGLIAATAISLLLPMRSGAQTVKVGSGAYWLKTQGSDGEVPPAPMRTEAMLNTAAQTNQWYSSLIFSAKPEVIYAQPLTFKAGPDGL